MATALSAGVGKLRFLSRAGQRDRGAVAARDDLGDGVKISRPDFVLVLGRGVTIGLGGELCSLQL